MIEKYIRQSWVLGQKYQVKIKPDRRVIPKDAIRFFSDTMQISIGTTFKGREDEFRKAVTKILVTGKHSQALKDLQAELGTLLQDPEMLRRMNWMLRDMTNRARNYSRVERFSQIGITEVEIVAVLDQRTSPICKLMHGRRVSVETAREFIKEFTDTDPKEVFDEFKSTPKAVVDSMDGKATADIVKNQSIKLPPYHPGGCRTTVVASTKTRVTTKSGKTLRGEIQKPNFNEIKRAISKAKSPHVKAKLFEDFERQSSEAESRFGDLRNLTKNELLSKIDSLKLAKWDPKKLDEHFRDHNEMRFRTADDYANRCMEIIKKPDEVYAYIDNLSDGRRFGFRDKKTGHFVGVSYDSMQIHTLHRNRNTARYLRIL